VFLGDLGHSLTEAELAPLRGAEVVLVPAGGPPTIDLPEIPALLDAIGPRFVLPMHYKTPRINLNIQPLERFLEALPTNRVVRAGSSSVDITRNSLPDQRTTVVLEHAR
jgi:L-ascorbate metabolism protein UlaG (beta-lactamase superfamily)